MTHVRIERARTAMALRQYEAAKCEAMAALEDEPNNSLARLILGEAYLRTNDFEKGREEAARLTIIAPDWGWGFWLLGWCWLMDDKGYPGLSGRARRMPKARAAAEQALACDPSQPVFFALAAAASLESGLVDEALRYTDRGLAVAPDFHHLHRLRGQALRLMNQPDKALECVQTSLSIAPDDAISHREVAELLFSKGQFDSARERIREAMRLEPQDRYARDLMFRIVQTQHWLLRASIWLYQATRLLRVWVPIWIGVVLLIGVPLNYWVESRLRGHWSATAILVAWGSCAFAPLATLVIPLLSNFLWLMLGRDQTVAALTLQERWDRSFPAIAILLAVPVAAIATWLQSLSVFEYFLTAIVVAILQSCGAAMYHRVARWLWYCGTVVFAMLVPLLLIHKFGLGSEWKAPAIILNVQAIIFLTVFRIAQRSVGK